MTFAREPMTQENGIRAKVIRLKQSVDVLRAQRNEAWRHMEAVRALHSGRFTPSSDSSLPPRCVECNKVAPCPTERALGG